VLCRQGATFNCCGKAARSANHNVARVVDSKKAGCISGLVDESRNADARCAMHCHAASFFFDLSEWMPVFN
jgi:hypothetical protein